MGASCGTSMRGLSLPRRTPRTASPWPSMAAALPSAGPSPRASPACSTDSASSGTHTSTATTPGSTLASPSSASSSPTSQDSTRCAFFFFLKIASFIFLLALHAVQIQIHRKASAFPTRHPAPLSDDPEHPDAFEQGKKGSAPPRKSHRFPVQRLLAISSTAKPWLPKRILESYHQGIRQGHQPFTGCPSCIGSKL